MRFMTQTIDLILFSGVSNYFKRVTLLTLFPESIAKLLCSWYFNVISVETVIKIFFPILILEDIAVRFHKYLIISLSGHVLCETSEY
jgi:hypothetical protein